MATGNANDYVYVQYTANDASTWTLRVLDEWGAAADAGFGTYDPADPVWPTGPRMQPRKVKLYDPVSGRRTVRPVGSPTATVLTRGTIVATIARGASGAYNLTSGGMIAEKRPDSAPIIHKANPVTA